MSANGMACTRNRLREEVGDGSRARRTISAALSIARPVASWRSRASIAALSRTRVRAISSSISCRGLFPSYGARSLSVIGAAELGGDAITSLSLSNWLSSKLQIAVGDAKQDWLQYKREAICPVPRLELRPCGCYAQCSMVWRCRGRQVKSPGSQCLRNLADMTSHCLPTLDLAPVLVRDSTAHEVTTIPLKPTTRIIGMNPPPFCAMSTVAG